MKLKRSVVTISVVCLLVGSALLLPPVKRAVFIGVVTLLDSFGVPLNDGGSHIPHVGTYEEYHVYDPTFDVLIYHFDGRKGKKPVDVAAAGLKAIRKGGFRHQKTLSLVILCDLKSTNQLHRATYPYGMILETAAIRNLSTPIKDLTTNTFIDTPFSFDYRVGDFFYKTSNISATWAQVSENTNYLNPTVVVGNAWLTNLRNLTNKAEAHATFGVPLLYVRERGTYSEVYPIIEGATAGGVRIWYEGNKVARTGCIMTNR